MIKYIMLMAIFSILFFCGCKKKDTQPAAIPIDNNLKKYFSYKPGSYWIYKDAISGSMDSVVTISFDTGAAYGAGQGIVSSPGGRQNYEYVNMVFNEYTSGATLYTTQWKWTLLNSAIMAAMPDFYSILLLYPLTETKAGGWITDTYDNSNTLSTLVIGGNSYEFVAEISHRNYAHTYNDTFYINIDVGIIKMKINHFNDSTPDTTRHVWELQRYSIIR